MDDVTEPLPDPLTGGTSFVRGMAARLADKRPFENFEQWEWDWLRADLSIDPIQEGLSYAFEHNPNPHHSMVFQTLDAARRRVEHGLPPYGKLWEEPSEEEKRLYIEKSKKRLERYREEYNL
jgi:hypothetical protein